MEPETHSRSLLAVSLPVRSVIKGIKSSVPEKWLAIAIITDIPSNTSKQIKKWTQTHLETS